MFFFVCLIEKADSDKLPHKEDYIDFITQGTTSKEKMTLCKLHNFCEKHNLPYGNFYGKEIIPNKDGSSPKGFRKRKRNISS